ncbi:hypothetical protein UPYG_G00004870 [Umbra pygmaea]|uniref:C2H2-type domain-containing protein n=1 Tax=Umbra pygmaea TaxID=75934 RepID=A0ABD0XH68_UMBPY
MDAVPCSWNNTRVQESFARTRPASDTLTKLARLVAQKQEGHGQTHVLPDVSVSVCTECGQGFPDVAELFRHQQGQHALRKPHRCSSCGMEFSLLSSLQLHKCVQDAAPCQLCWGNPQLAASCSACKSSNSDSQSLPDKPLYHQSHHHDSLSYACAPCGKGFSQKEALLHHQQADCYTVTSRTVKLVSRQCDTPSPDSALSDTSPPESPPSDSNCTSTRSRYRPTQCPLCPKRFRSGAGLACHQRVAHRKEWSVSKYLPPSGQPSKRNGNKANGKAKQKSQLLSCRTCDMVFVSTAKLYLHRKESHSRERDVKREPRPLISKRRKGETYPCGVCGKVFLHHLSLRAHAKKHSQEPSSNVQPGGKGAKETKLAEKTAKKLKISQKLGRPLVNAGRGRPKKKPVVEEEGEYPCPSCAQVFSLQSALKVHEELHQPSGTMRHCSVCSQCMGTSKKPKAKLRKAYHCVPCLKAFVTLDTFLQHCQGHLVSGEEEGSYSDPGVTDNLN